MFSPKKALTSLFAQTLAFESGDETYLQLEDACAKYGMNFADDSTNTIVASGELFVLSVRGEADFTGLVNDSQAPIFKAMLTTYCPHNIQSTGHKATVAEALEEMAGMLTLQNDPAYDSQRRAQDKDKAKSLRLKPVKKANKK